MFAFLSIRFAAIKDCFSLVSIMIGILGLGHLVSFSVLVLLKMFSICFFICLIRRVLFIYMFLP